jgi:myb proto-oncogene protein
MHQLKIVLQDARLKQLVEEYNLRWDVIALHFPDRSDVQCQQRWQKVVNPELVKGPWTKEVSHECNSSRVDSSPVIWKI